MKKSRSGRFWQRLQIFRRSSRPTAENAVGLDRAQARDMPLDYRPPAPEDFRCTLGNGRNDRSSGTETMGPIRTWLPYFHERTRLLMFGKYQRERSIRRKHAAVIMAAARYDD